MGVADSRVGNVGVLSWGGDDRRMQVGVYTRWKLVEKVEDLETDGWIEVGSSKMERGG